MVKTKIVRILIICLSILGIYGLTNTVKAETIQTAMCIDYPVQNQEVKTSLYIQGWFLSEDVNTEVEILIDGNKIEDIGRYAREDVLQAYKNQYGGRETNSKPGFNKTVNVSSLKDGQHNLTINLKASTTGKIIKTTNTIFSIKKYNAAMCIDYPVQNQEVKTSLYIQGWFLSEDANTEVEILIDGNKIENIERYAREDVLQVYKNQYGGRETNTKPGFNKTVNVSSLKDGNHNLTINLKASTTGEIIKTTNTIFNTKKYNAAMCIDFPVQNQTVKTSLYIQGWFLSEDANTELEILIDGNKIEDIERYAREDVLQVYKNQYGGRETNTKPGFNKTVDVSSLKDGNHNLTINLKASKTGEIIKTTNTIFNTKKYNAAMCVDFPMQNQTVKTSLYVQGWFLSEDANTELEILIDGNKIENIERYAREDVLQVYKNQYGGRETNTKPGFNITVDVSNLKDGDHSLTINLKASKTGELIKTTNISFKIKKYEGIIGLEYPTRSNFNEDVYIQGWEMSELDNSYIKIYLDGKETKASIERYEREDIIESIKQYGDEKVNTTPGFRTTLDLSEYSQGTHTITIKLYTKLDEQIASVSKKILIYRDRYYGIDVSKHQGEIDFEALSKTEIEFMIIRAGYGRDDNQEDIKFEYNYSQAKKYGIPVGVYWYSYATTVEQAKLEAENCLRTISGKSFELPVFFDIEDPSVTWVDKQTQTNMCLAFAETIKEAGFDKVGIYASKYWIKDHLYIEQIPDSYAIWVASYGQNDGEIPDSTYEYLGRHELWQYTSRGSMAGINGDVDMNVCYKKYW